MANLNEYLKQAQRFIRDSRQRDVNPANLLSYVNRARREVAERTHCVRRLSTISGSIQSWMVTAGGSGYSATPTVTVAVPDFPSGAPPNPNGLQATASATVQGGVIVGINNLTGGDGYFQPTLTITDTTGSGAAATATVAHINTLNRGQEVYNFADVDLSQFPGVDSCFGVQSVSLIYSNYRYSVPVYSFSIYQAMVRQYPSQYQYVPTFGSQFGQGSDGSFYMYPLPSQTYQLEWDMYCLPQDLTNNFSTDVIPKPWDDCVPYFVAHLAYLELQNFNAANMYLDLFDKMMLRKSQSARVSRVVNPYGRF